MAYLKPILAECCSTALYDSLLKHASGRSHIRGIAIAVYNRQAAGGTSPKYRRGCGVEGFTVYRGGPHALRKMSWVYGCR